MASLKQRLHYGYKCLESGIPATKSFQTSGTVCRKVGRNLQRKSTSAQDRYSALSAPRHRHATPMAATDSGPVRMDSSWFSSQPG
ncbi:hypothetical protein TNCV_3386321 [Trichonephila clavipes]|nr:hypothetical protein TNCV_3386321 [Trichonephila clavipes]